MKLLGRLIWVYDVVVMRATKGWEQKCNVSLYINSACFRKEENNDCQSREGIVRCM